jgi:U1 small nuclear ribonucleoprotein
MTAHLPPSLLSLFAPRPPLPYLPPIELRKPLSYTGISQYVKEFEKTDNTKKEQVNFPFETKQSRKERLNKEKKKKHEQELEKIIKEWDPKKDPKATSDPYKTLFVGRLNYDTSEHKLKREFEIYGPVKKVRIVTDKNGSPRGYAFVEFEKERDMKTAFKQADGKKIDGRRIVVDIERGRTIPTWRPRRLGGGLGFTRLGSDDVNQKFSGR